MFAAIRAWNLMGGDIHMDDRLAACAEMIGVQDIDVLVAQLMTIREYMRETS